MIIESISSNIPSNIVSMFGSRAGTFSWSPAMLVVMMFCIFSAVSFSNHFIPALAFNKSLPSGSAV